MAFRETCLVVVLAIGGCALREPPGIVGPERNPRAGQWLDISGRTLERCEMRVTARYSVSNPDCRGPGVRMAEELALQRSPQGYVGRAQLDRLLPGRCGWFFEEIVFDFWPLGGDSRQAPQWQWKQHIGADFRWTSIQHTVECGVTRRLPHPGSCGPKKGGSVAYPPGDVRARTRTLVVDFERAP